MRINDIIGFKKNFGTWLKIILVITLSTILYLIPVKIIEYMVDISQSNGDKVLLVGVLLISMYIFSAIAGSYTDYVINCFAFDVSNRIRLTVFKNILNLKVEYFNKLLDGKSFGSLIEDTKIISESSIKPLCFLMKSTISFALGIILVSTINPYITIILLVIGIIAAIINKKMGEKYQDFINNTREASDEIWNLLNHINKFFIEIKLNKREKHYLEKSDSLNSELKNKEKKEDSHNKKMNTIDTIIFMGTIGVLFTCTSYLVYKKQMSIGGLVAIMMYNSILIDPLLEIASTIKEYMKMKVSLKRVNKYSTDMEVNTCEKSSFKGKIENIKLENIEYVKDGKEVLKNININIEKNKKIAIIGESGSGKTTLSNILCGLIEPTSGNIKINNIAVENLDSYKNNIAVLLQNCNIIPESLKENILLYTDLMEEELIKKYINIVGLNDKFIKKEVFSDTTVANFSGGEEKRIGILRALIKDSDVYLFDEMSNSLDNNISRSIMDSIIDLLKNKIVIAIDHRLNLIENFDEIILLNNGKIEMIGSHKELLEKSNYYKELYNLKKEKSKIV